MVKTTYTAKELMEVALMCIGNTSPDSDPTPLDIHCHTCGRLVAEDYAATVCFPGGHDIETSNRGAA